MGTQGNEERKPESGDGGQGNGSEGGQGNGQQQQAPAPDASKLQEQIDNLNRALKEEREAKKTQAERLAKLDEIEKAEAKRKDDEMKKKGEYDVLLSQKDSELESLRAETARLKAFEESHKKALEARETEALAKIDPSKLELVKMAIDGKDSETRVSVIERFAEEFKKAGDFGGQPNGGNPPGKGDAAASAMKGAKTMKEALAAGLGAALKK